MDFDAFLNDTANFMTRNIVLPPPRCTPIIHDAPKWQKSAGQSGVFTMSLTDLKKQGSRLADKQPCDILKIEQSSDPKAKTFKMYFCYYEPDEVHLLVVDKGANLMFTPTMNGCSFGVGSEAKGGARMVGHVNESREEATEKGAIKQAENQQAMLTAALFASKPSIMGPETYTPFGSGLSGTTFGVRDAKTDSWSFYTQVWKRVSASEYYLGGVAKFA